MHSCAASHSPIVLARVLMDDSWPVAEGATQARVSSVRANREHEILGVVFRDPSGTAFGSSGNIYALSVPHSLVSRMVTLRNMNVLGRTSG